MSNKRTTLAKVLIKETGERLCITLYHGNKLLDNIREQLEMDGVDIKTEDDYEVLDEKSITRGEWAQFASEELENMNYHREIDLVDLAMGYMDDRQAKEFVEKMFELL
jgi:hypothetical protein